MLQTQTVEEFKTQQGRKLLLKTSLGFAQDFILLSATTSCLLPSLEALQQKEKKIKESILTVYWILKSNMGLKHRIYFE